MFNIGGFFGKIQEAYSKDVQLRTAAAKALKECANIDIPLEKIEYKSNVLHVGGISHAAKATLFLKKQKILDALRAEDLFARIKDVK